MINKTMDEKKLLEKRLKLSENRYDRLLAKNKSLSKEIAFLNKKIEALEKVILSINNGEEIKNIFKYLDFENENLRKTIEYLKKEYNIPEDDIMLL